MLSSTEREEMGLHISHLSNDGFAPGSLPAGTVHLERSTVLTPTGLLQQLSFTSYAASSVTIPLVLLVNADFLDIFEVRGIHRDNRGTRVYSCTADSLEVVYRGLDGTDRSTALRLEAEVLDVSETELRFAFDLEPRCTRKLALMLDFHPQADSGSSPRKPSMRPWRPRWSGFGSTVCSTPRSAPTTPLSTPGSTAPPPTSICFPPNSTTASIPMPVCPGSVVPSDVMA
ncbi:glycogen debranching N-terminal domain-containing protein [Cyanobium sp. ATX-6F1]